MYNPFAFSVDITSIRFDLIEIQNSDEIQFKMSNKNIGNLLSKKIKKFKKISETYPDTRISIERDRKDYREISIKGIDAYIVYKKIKDIYCC